MQTDHNQLYKLTSQRTGKSEDTYKDVGNFVFKELNAMLAAPKSLITRLKGVGYWFLRKTRMEIILNNFPIEEGKVVEDFKKQKHYDDYAEKLRRQHLFQERLPEYEEYVKTKRELKKQRYGTEIPLESIERENQSPEPSQTESTEHTISNSELDTDNPSDSPSHQGTDQMEGGTGETEIS